MSNRKTRVILLCEDKQQERFMRAYLKSRKFNMNKVDTVPLSNGRGSGEQWVREQYTPKILAYRSEVSRSKGGVSMLIMLDADNDTIKKRLTYLDDSLEERRRPTEKIAILIPKRNIETWIHYALTGAAGESVDYKDNQLTAKQCKDAAKKFAESICHQALPPSAPNSLFAACEELKRIL